LAAALRRIDMTTFITIGTITLTDQWQYTDVVVSSYFRLTHVSKPLDTDGVEQSSNAAIAQVNLANQIFSQQVFSYQEDPERLIIEPPITLDVRKMGLKLLPNQLPWTVKVEVLNIVNGTLVLDPTDFPGGIGPKGDKGDTGAAGPQGPKGDTGDAGATGTPGQKGDTGTAGPQGPTGDKGNTGAVGPQGSKGDEGGTGTPGLQGPKGDVGADGAAGLPGPRGDVGADGAAGLPGPRGDQGDAGPAGRTGNTGDTGATGATGATGLKGDTGDTGATGAAGPQGLKGDTGNAGTTGATGATGLKGDTGNAGATGATGATGLKGDTGNTGATGAAGPQGLKGDTGNTGATGAAGPQGLKGDTGSPPTPFFARTAAEVTFSNVTGDNALVTTQLPVLAVGDSFEIDAWGRAFNNTGGNVNCTWKLNLDTSTVLTTGTIANTTATTPKRWFFRAVATVVSATQVRVVGTFFLTTAATDSVQMLGAGSNFQGDSGNIAYDSTAPRALNLIASMGTANANAQMTIRGAVVRKL
jgi:hypothetical protein